MPQVIVIQDDFEPSERFDKASEGSAVIMLEVYGPKGEIAEKRKLYASPKTVNGLLKGKGTPINRAKRGSGGTA